MKPKRTKVPTLKPRLTTIDSRVKAPAKETDPFYSSPEWRQLRGVVLIRDGFTCVVAGCGRREPRMFVDHIIEIQDGGQKLDPANCQTLCGMHHTLKTNAERDKRMAR